MFCFPTDMGSHVEVLFFEKYSNLSRYDIHYHLIGQWSDSTFDRDLTYRNKKIISYST